jgi:RNA polymerase sigma factor (sigma-70 family)
MTRSSGSRGAPRSARDREQRFVVLYDAHLHRILGYALRRTDEASAQDVVAETFLVAWRRLEDVPDGSDARLWLYGVARKVLANHRRKESRRERLRSALELGHLTSLCLGDEEPNLLFAEAFERLPARDRELLGLWAWEGLDYRELAVVLGCSVNAAKIRVHRARRRFALQLSKQGDTRLDVDAAPQQNVRSNPAMEETS